MVNAVAAPRWSKIRNMKLARISSLTVFLCAIAVPQSGSVRDIWEPVRFLVGVWEGNVQGEPGTGKAEREYRFVLDNRYLEIRSKSTYPVQAKNPKGEVHEDWGMISYDRSRKTAA